MSNVTDRFNQLVKDKGISLSKLSKETGISLSTFTRTRDGSTPRDTTVKAICDFFGVSESWFMYGEGNKIEALESDSYFKIKLLNALVLDLDNTSVIFSYDNKNYTRKDMVGEINSNTKIANLWIDKVLKEAIDGIENS